MPKQSTIITVPSHCETPSDVNVVPTKTISGATSTYSLMTPENALKQLDDEITDLFPNFSIMLDQARSRIKKHWSEGEAPLTA